MPCGPDIKVYEALARAGQLDVIVAREAGQMVGYCLVVTRRHIHYAALCAFEDSYFLTRDARRGLAGYVMIRETLDVLRARGVVRAYFMTKEFLSMAKLFERLGGDKVDEVYGFWLAGASPRGSD